MSNFLARARVFVSANKTFVAVVIIGVVLVLLSGGGSVIKIASQQIAYDSDQGIDLPGVPALMRESGGGAVAYNYSDGYSKGGATLSIAPMPPSYNPNPATPELPSDKKIIKNGSLNLLVKSADSAATLIESIAVSNGGFIQNSDIREVSEGVKSGSVSVRIPSANFTVVMEAIKKIAVKVNWESVNSSDVTAQYVDLEAQLKNYRAEEKQYQDIMVRAVKIDEILNVASRLSDVRGRIERTEGQLNSLSRQVSMSVISVNLTAEPEVKVFGIVWRPLTVVKQAFKSMLTDLAGFVDWLIMFVFKVPVYILRLAVAVLIAFALWRVIVWFKRKFITPANTV